MSIEVKICGMTNSDDVKYALEYGADYCGFVIYGKSPRGITADRMDKIIREVREPFKAVAVFVDEPRDVIQRISDEAGIFAVQLHGNEIPADFEGFPLPVWRAIRAVSGKYKPDPEAWKTERYLIDSTVPGLHGGTGVTADWKTAAEFCVKARTMLAGGLTPANVRSAVEEVKPYGVDVVSGIELKPGIKDRTAMKSFILNAKSCNSSEKV